MRGLDAGEGVLDREDVAGDDRLVQPAVLVDAGESEQIAAGVGLALVDVVDADHGADRVLEPGELEDQLDLLADGAGADRHRHRLGQRPDEGDGAVADGQLAADLVLVAVDLVAEHRLAQLGGRLDAAQLEGALDDLGVGVAGELAEVGLLGELDAALGEGVAKQPVEQRLVIGDGPVEVEDDGTQRQGTGEGSHPGAAANRFPCGEGAGNSGGIVTGAGARPRPGAAGRGSRRRAARGRPDQRELQGDRGRARYVVRRWSDDGGLLAIDRDNEHENSVRAAEAGVGAPVVAYLPEHGALVFEFLEGRTLRPRTCARRLPAERVADACRAPARRGALPRRLRHVRDPAAATWASSTSAASGCPTATASSSRRCERIQEALAGRPEDTVPCNNDLLAENFIDSGDGASG